MITKADLFLIVRQRLGYTQQQMANALRVNRRSTISKYESNDDKINHQRLCQLYVVYIKRCKQDVQLDTIFNNHLDKMFKE